MGKLRGRPPKMLEPRHVEAGMQSPHMQRHNSWQGRESLMRIRRQGITQTMIRGVETTAKLTTITSVVGPMLGMLIGNVGPMQVLPQNPLVEAIKCMVGFPGMHHINKFKSTEGHAVGHMAATTEVQDHCKRARNSPNAHVRNGKSPIRSRARAVRPAWKPAWPRRWQRISEREL